MKASIVPFPLGGFQGAPALRCIIDDPSELGRGLIDEMRAQALSGVRLTWLVTDLWGTDDWERFLIQLMDDARFGEMPITTIRSSVQSTWSNIGIDWIIDISQTFGKPMNSETLRETAVHASAVPVPTELVWFDPPTENLTVDALESIFDAYAPTVAAWVYSEDEELRSLAFSRAGKAAASWGTRARSEGVWTAT